MSEGGRIVTLSSAASQQHAFPPALAKKIDTKTLTLDGLEAFVQDYENAVKSPSDADGFPHKAFLPSYTMSKIAVNLMTAVLARAHPGILINCCCPGAYVLPIADLSTFG